MPLTKRRKEIVFEGVPLAPGIAIGPAYVLASETIEVPHRRVLKRDILAEKDRFEQARLLSIKQVAKLQKKAKDLPEAASEDIRLLLDVQLNLLGQSKLTKGILARISQDRINAEQAVELELAEHIKSFATLENKYIASRAKDISEVARRLVRNLLSYKYVSLHKAPKGAIIFSEEVTASDTAFMNPDQVGGFVSKVGSWQSHAAIMARSLELPAVGNASIDVLEINQDDRVIIDGLGARIIVRPTTKTLAKYRFERQRFLRQKRKLTKAALQPAVTKNGTHVGVYANLSNLDELPIIQKNGAEGIGLLRTEFLYLNRDVPPTMEEQYNAIIQPIKAMDGRPVTVRIADLGGDKISPAFSVHTQEENPALGLRGIRFFLENPDLLKDQYRAILQASAFGPVRILLPMVTNTQQVKDARKILAETARSMRRQKIKMASNLPEIGVMLETPAVALTAGDYARIADFFSVGTNDLVQYALATDRTNERVAKYFEPDHPAVIFMINHAVQEAKENNIAVTLCGEMAGDTDYTEDMLRIGLRSFSMAATHIPIVKDHIRGLDLTV